MFAEYLDGLREYAEGRMDECSRVTVMRKTGATTQDEITGQKVPVWAAVLTDVPFRLKGGRSRTVTIGGVEFEEATAEGHLPSDTLDVEDGDLLNLTEGEWAGTAWRVIEAVKGDQRTARRLPIVEVPRPQEWT